MNSLLDIIPNNKDIIIHSSLSSFGENIEIKELIQHIANKAGGWSNTTILMPTFTYSFTQNRLFDINHSISETGKMSEVFRNMYFDSNRVARTNDPIHSLALYGKNQQQYLQKRPSSSFGKASCFESLLHNDAYCLLLGTDYNSCSFYHYAEESMKVPYRSYKDFYGKFKDKELEIDIKHSLYVRDELSLGTNINNFGLELEKRGDVQITSIKNAIIRSFSIKSLYGILTDSILKEPYALVRTKRKDWKVKTRVKDEFKSNSKIRC